MNDEEDMSCKRCDINCDNCGCYDGCNCREHYKYNRNCMDCIGLTKSLKTDTYCDKCKIEQKRQEEYRDWLKSIPRVELTKEDLTVEFLTSVASSYRSTTCDQANRSCVKLSINK